MSDGYSCSVCHKTYKRREHLQRHVASHSALRPYRCGLCNQSYQRADVLRRHTQTCQGRTKAGGAPAGRRACDFCVRQKKACSTGQPCDNCRRKSVPCNYSSSAGLAVANDDDASPDAEVESHTTDNQSLTVTASDITVPGLTFGDNSPFEYLGSYTSVYDMLEDSSTNPSWLDFFNLAAEGFSSTEPQMQLDSYSFHFLDNFTSRTGLVESFDCGTFDQRVGVVSSFLMDERDTHTALATNSGVSGNPPTTAHLGAASTRPPLLLQTSILHGLLITQTHQILLQVKQVVTVKPRNSVVTLEWSRILEQTCMQFFSPHSLGKFLALFWNIWHPNVNFVHRPTFNPTSCKPILLAAMAVIGTSPSYRSLYLSVKADKNRSQCFA